MKEKKNWYHLIDAIRGVAILNMVAFHFLYDVYVVFGHLPDWYRLLPVRIWQQFICITFIVISGISCHFSKNNIKRGILLNVYGLCITFVTLVFMPTQVIWFGILNFIGCAVILLELLRRPLSRIPAIPGLVCSLLLFLLFRDVQSGSLSFMGLPLFSLPEALYQWKALTPFGFPYPGFASSDYFPMLPWFFLFTAGFYLWNIIKGFAAAEAFFCKKVPLLSLIGTKSIWIYLIHQPAAMLIAYLFFR